MADQELEKVVRDSLRDSIAATVNLFHLSLIAGFQAGLAEEPKESNPLRGKDMIAAGFWDNGWEIGSEYLRNERT